jgi:hypothetical protein
MGLSHDPAFPMELGDGEKKRRGNRREATGSLLARGGALSSPRPFFQLFFFSHDSSWRF